MNYPATCPHCGRLHQITARDNEMFGPDAVCIKCCDWKHVEYMQKNARRFKMTCTPGCRCGFGPKSVPRDDIPTALRDSHAIGREKRKDENGRAYPLRSWTQAGPES